MPLSRNERSPSSSEQPSAAVSRSGRVSRCARSTNTRPSSTDTSRYSPGSPSGGPTCDRSSRSASSSSRSVLSIFASWSTATPSGCLATYGTMYSSRRSFCDTSRIAASRELAEIHDIADRGGLDHLGLRGIVRGDRVELLEDPCAQPGAAQRSDPALGREHAVGRKLQVAAIE